MRTTRKLWLCCSMFALLHVHYGYGQITIQKTDVQQIFAPGAVLKFHFDTSKYVNVGKTGGPNVYDFSALSFPDTMTQTLYAVSQIPQLAARFSTSSFVWGTSPQSISNSPIFLFTDSSFIQLANATVFPDSQEYRYDNPYEEILRFPATYNLQWNTSPGGGGVDTTFVNNIATHVTTGWNSAETNIIDGFGTLIVQGKSYDCLRVKSVEIGNYTYKGFSYFTKGGMSLLISSRKDQNDTGIVKVDDVTTINNATATLVSQNRIVPSTILLSQNYPNPFNPSTHIEFTIPAQAHVVLRIYDLLGRTVATLADGVIGKGAHSVEWKPVNCESGVYFCRLQSNGATVVRQLLYVK